MQWCQVGTSLQKLHNVGWTIGMMNICCCKEKNNDKCGKNQEVGNQLTFKNWLPLVATEIFEFDRLHSKYLNRVDEREGTDSDTACIQILSLCKLFINKRKCIIDKRTSKGKGTMTIRCWKLQKFRERN